MSQNKASTSSMPISRDNSRRQNINATKRSASEDSDIEISPKRGRYYYRLQSESSICSEDETTESICSHQGYETELVMDTPDTESKSEYSDDSDVDLEIEYEVESSSGNEPSVGIDTSSGAEDFLAVAGAMAAVICDTSVNASSTDGEDSSTSAPEIEVNRKDKGYNMCIHCNLLNDNPMFRFCNKCFQVRKSFFPPRPRGYKKKDEIRKRSPNFTKEDINPTASGSSSFGSSIEKVSDVEDQDKPSTNSLLSDSKELCIMCHVNTKNSIFVHGSTAHMCCCYECALRSWKCQKTCPVCKRKANNVVKVFVI